MNADRSVRTAAILLVCYGIAVVGNALVWQAAGDWQDASDFPRALIRLAGTGLIAWGLMQRSRWAWWAGILFPGFWIASAVLALVAYMALVDADGPSQFPPAFAGFMVVSVAILTWAVGLLLTRQVRDAFRVTRG